jgi:hypothetical protein
MDTEPTSQPEQGGPEESPRSLVALCGFGYLVLPLVWLAIDYPKVFEDDTGRFYCAVLATGSALILIWSAVWTHVPWIAVAGLWLGGIHAFLVGSLLLVMGVLLYFTLPFGALAVFLGCIVLRSSRAIALEAAA